MGRNPNYRTVRQQLTMGSPDVAIGVSSSSNCRCPAVKITPRDISVLSHGRLALSLSRDTHNATPAATNRMDTNLSERSTGHDNVHLHLWTRGLSEISRWSL